MIKRRVRGILAVSAVWALLWGVAGALFTGAQLTGILAHIREHPWLVVGSVARIMWIGARSFALWGAMGGLAFATLLAATERRGGVGRLQRWRVGLWGALAGGLPPLLTWYYAGHRLWLQFPRAAGLTGIASVALGVSVALATLEIVRRGRAGAREAAAASRRPDASGERAGASFDQLDRQPVGILDHEGARIAKGVA